MEDGSLLNARYSELKMTNPTDIAIDSLFKKGGSAHFSLRHGSRICPNGEKCTVITKPMSDEEWIEYQKATGTYKPEVIMLGCDGG